MKIATIILAVLCSVLIGSCKKNETLTPGISDVKITITSPEEGHIYHTGDSVHVVASVSFEGVMHGYEVHVTDTATGSVVFDADEHEHKDKFDIDRSFAVTGSQPMVLKLRLLTEIDHNGSIAEKQVIFQYQP